MGDVNTTQNLLYKVKKNLKMFICSLSWKFVQYLKLSG